MAEITPGENTGAAYRAAVSASLQRLGGHSIQTAVLLEFGVILGVGIAAAVASLVHWRWWSLAKEITANEVFGDTISPMIGGAAVTLIAIAWRWRRQVAKARIATWVADQENIAQLTKSEGSDEVSNAVHVALSKLFGAYRELQIVSNRTDDSAWYALYKSLEEYQASYALLPSVARRFHEKDAPALIHFAHSREFDQLLPFMEHASDALLCGECEADLNISVPNPVPMINKSSARDRFIILNIFVGNCDNEAVSLSPLLHLNIGPGEMHTFQADGEPLKEWEDNRHENQQPANPPLAMPLQLPPKNSAAGYWCFFIGNELDKVHQLRDGRNDVEAVLEIRDLVNRRRTKSERFKVGIGLLRSPLSPLPSDNGGDARSSAP